MPLAAIDVLGYRSGPADPMKNAAGLGSRLSRLVINPLQRGELVIVTKAHREWSYWVTDLPGWLNAVADAVDALVTSEENRT
jgi:hypothetical protein